MYKNRYCLALYGKDDELIVLCDTVDELARFVGRTKAQVRGSVSEQFRKKSHYFIYNHKAVELHFIDMREEVE